MKKFILILVFIFHCTSTLNAYGTKRENVEFKYCPQVFVDNRALFHTFIYSVGEAIKNNNGEVLCLVIAENTLYLMSSDFLISLAIYGICDFEKEDYINDGWDSRNGLIFPINAELDGQFNHITHWYMSSLQGVRLYKPMYVNSGGEPAYLFKAIYNPEGEAYCKEEKNNWLYLAWIDIYAGSIYQANVSEMNNITTVREQLISYSQDI